MVRGQICACACRGQRVTSKALCITDIDVLQESKRQEKVHKEEHKMCKLEWQNKKEAELKEKQCKRSTQKTKAVETRHSAAYSAQNL